MKSRQLPPYCIPGRPLEEVAGVVVHYFSAKNVERGDRRFDLEVCRNLFLDLNRPRERRQFYMQSDAWPAGRMYASAHVLIGRDGETWKLVEFDQEAWHAGASILNGRSGCNRFTIGVELVGTNTSGFELVQYRRLAELLVELEDRHGFPPENIAGHDEVRWAAIEAGLTNKAKYDPSGRKDGRGGNFEWGYLRRLMVECREERESAKTANA